MSVKGGRIEVTVALDADPNSATMVVLAPHRKAEPFSDDFVGKMKVKMVKEWDVRHGAEPK